MTSVDSGIETTVVKITNVLNDTRTNENHKYREETGDSTPISSLEPIVLPSNVSEIALNFARPERYKTSRNKHVYDKIKSGYTSHRFHHFVSCTNYQASFMERRIRVAVVTNNTIMIKQLLNSGVSLNEADEQGRTPLHLASCSGYTELVRLLLEHGADPNRRDCMGNTPLHLAAVTGKTSVVTLLLNAGTDLLSLDKKGYNPLQLAQKKLKLLQYCKGDDMLRIREEVQNVKDMLLAYSQKQKDTHKKMDTLSNICSRLTLSNESDQIQDDIENLLANLNTFSITQ